MNRLPAEWEPQSFVQFTFPHEDSDWAESFDIVVPCFVEIIETVAKFESALVICTDVAATKKFFQRLDNIYFIARASNDTWARDHSAITILKDDKPVLLDFFFNGWGLKFPADKDNLITAYLFNKGIYEKPGYQIPGLTLEGGAIESDGKGTILTTTNCLLSPNRNPHLLKEAMESQLKQWLGAERVLWLEHGDLIGDDTDSHIDTLARFCDDQTISYVQCNDESDEHYETLLAMEQQLKHFKKMDGNPYRLIPLPLPDPCYNKAGRRLPATYANFLIINDAVLVPIYDQQKDQEVLKQLAEIFKDRQVIGINCLPLIEQHGSLHCITMQFPHHIKLNV